MNVLKLRNLIEGIEPKMDDNARQEAAWSVEEKKAALEAIAKYNEYGKPLYREGGNLIELAHTLSKIAENAQRFVNSQLEEQKDAWFDRVMPERNMKEMAKCSEEFRKYAMEAHVLEQRMQALYEEMGGKLSKYFEIKDLNESSAAAVSKLK